MDSIGITNRTGMTGGIRRPVRRKAQASARQSVRRNVAGLVVVLGAIALLAVALVPASNTTVAHPSNEGGDCGNCHPYRTTSFLTVSGLPVGSYTPGLAYTVIVTLADPNGATGENSFDLILSAAGGTLTTTDPNAEINAATEASAEDSVSPMSASQWTVLWTAPTSGTVTIDVWAVMDQTGATGIKAVYDLKTSTLTAGAAIPEFPALLIPVVGIGLAVVVAAKATRKSE
jgi:hypothetical protein